MTRRQMAVVVVLSSLVAGSTGCAPGIIFAFKHPEITAVSLNPCDGDKCCKEAGIPFYLPKPLLIVSKNFRNIEAPTVGLTDSAPIPGAFDDQSKYADLNARTNFNGLNGAAITATEPTPGTPATPPSAVSGPGPVLNAASSPVTPGAVPSDGLAPETFFTYQIVFVPDMTQKYGLRVHGGPGEIRAAMNLVNGWQFTGVGPFYIKDSSTAQDILASGISARLGGQAAADVLNASANLGKVLKGGGLQSGLVGPETPAVQRLSEAIDELPRTMCLMTIPNYAEIHVYEPHLTPEGQMEWSEIVNLQFNRDYLGRKTTIKDYAPTAPLMPSVSANGNQSGAVGAAATLIADDPDVARAAVAGVFGLPTNTPALTVAPGLQAGAVGGVPAGGVNQIQVDCGAGDKCGPRKEFNLFRFGCDKTKSEHRPTIQNRSLLSGASIVPGLAGPGGPNTNPDEAAKSSKGKGNQLGVVEGTTAQPTILNQPIYNQPGFTPPGVPVTIPRSDPIPLNPGPK